MRRAGPFAGPGRTVVRGTPGVRPGANAARTPRGAPGAVVVKLGGRSLEADGAHRALAAELAALPGGALVVHGGGAEVTAWSRRLGLEPRFADGLRVTDPPTLEVAVAVLAGLANKRLVATLRAAGADAVGLSGVDGGVVAAAPHPQAATLGAVGRVAALDVRLVRTLLSDRRLPVIASIAAVGDGLVNLNADDLACALAAALRARALVLLSDTPGLALDGTVVPRLDERAARAALAGPQVTGGMRPKLRAALAALAGGVPAVHIAAWDGPGTLGALLGGRGPGTVLASFAPGAWEGLP